MTWQKPRFSSELPPLVDMQWLSAEEAGLDDGELAAEERRHVAFLDKIVHANQEFIPIGKTCQEVEFEDEEEEEDDEEDEEGEEDDSNEEEEEVEGEGEVEMVEGDAEVEGEPEADGEPDGRPATPGVDYNLTNFP
ncbi:anaphase-promoting complex subunit 15B-like isoform X2 [Varroa jacobsoni]|uniref:Uncharacterized protein n=1 Tax=Varroa destructor TaxID=109461 RepID=A0A7M7J822_VARDE|nr:anaphase-promoting complex subunit 15B-like isoform X2 [Varroa destructor]XP_022706274.1 anaphase-promoting complex subunit 15B-like isoform X2 [Varroa jacobsoni]